MDATFLTEEQIWGDDALGVIKKYGTAVGATDLAIALGAYMGNGAKTSDGLRSCASWSASADDRDVRVVDYRGDEYWHDTDRRDVAARPALPPSVTSAIRHGVAGAMPEYGSYPQTIASDAISRRLEAEYKSRRLSATGNKYTFDGAKNGDYGASFKAVDYPEYIMDGRRYIRVVATPRDEDSILSNGHRLSDGDICWIEVLPIKWMADRSGWWVAHQALFAGVKFDDRSSYDGNFSRTAIKKYLDKYFVPQMTQSRVSARMVDVDHTQSKADAFDVAKRRVGYGVTVVDSPMSVRDQIEFYIKTGKSFMLHGPSGVGKTARVEAIDPTLTAVPLWNGVLPEDIVGKVRYPSGEVKPLMAPRADGGDAGADAAPMAAGGVWVAPDWYTELVKKCNAEPNRQHVLFIDEVTNAKPTTQSLIFHIVLKKSISPSKGKLPKNAVVVLAGNDKNESGAAYNMPAPLFRRMSGHIYLQPNLPEWLEWASEKSTRPGAAPGRMNVHPLVSSFLAANPSAFYSAYDEEQPPQWAIDPRGWQQVSDIVYDNANTLRRELIENKIGREYAAALLGFARQPMLSLDDVLSGNFSRADIPETADLRLACALSMRHVDGRNLKTVRDFIGNYLGAENLAIFDSLWAAGDAERALQIAQMNGRGK